MRADDGTSAAATLQVQFGAGPFNNWLNRHIQLYISNLAFPPADVFQIPRTSQMQTVMCNLMRKLSLIILLHYSGIISAQSFSYPHITMTGKTTSDFIPSSWTLLDSAIGDLNNDKYNDLCFSIQHKDTVTIVKMDGDYSDSILSRPRILIICFYNPSSKEFDIVEQNNNFILCHDDPNMEEPYQGISISNGILQIDFQIFMNMGGWGMSNSSYKFRYQNKEFILIGAHCNSAQRNTGQTESRSYNFLTKKVKIESGNLSSDIQKTQWRTFKITKLKTLKTLLEPFTWEIENDYYL